MRNIEEVLQELAKPFHPSQIEWKPGSVNAEKTRALGLAYADVRAYQKRLDEACGGDWSITFTPWGERIICHLTICGVTRSSTGEANAQSERSEIGGTAAEAQAVKRSCAAFGLGRYLYNLPSIWVDYDAGERTFTDKGRQRLEQIVWQHYRNGQGGDTESVPAVEQNGAGQPQGAQAESVSHRQETAATSQADPADNLRKQFDELGQSLYGEQWAQIRRHNTERISEGKISDPAQLSAEHIQRLLDGLRSLQRKRQAAKTKVKA